MRPTITQLRDWDTHSISGAGDTAQTAANTLDSALTSVTTAMDQPDTWKGQTHGAAQLKVTQEHDHADEVRNVLQQIADEAKDAGADLTFARDYVLREVDSATLAGFTVSDTGTVTHTDAAKNEDADTLETRIQAGLDTIEEFDRLYGDRLEALRTDLAAMINGQPDVTLPDGRKADPDDVVRMLTGMTPDERRAYLEQLSEQDQRRVMQADPDAIGNMDGVPFTLRIDANEINIRNALHDEESKHTPAGDRRAAVLRDMLRQRSDPHRTPQADRPGQIPGTDSADDLLVERTFISFRNTTNGRWVEMIGRIDRNTKNAAVYIPGTGTNLDRSNQNYEAGWNLAHLSGAPVFVFADGDLPQNIGWEEPLRRLDPRSFGDQSGEHHALSDSAFNTRFALDLAPKLVAFGHELDTELDENAPGAKTTYIGHSYGGSALGTAEQLGLRADRVVYASSAGTGIFDAPWNDANPQVKRYSLTPPGDIIQGVQSFPYNPHGGDPDNTPGVTRLDTGFYSGESPEHRGLVAGAGSHGEYFNDRNSTAFRNIVEVIQGDRPTPYVHRISDDPVTVNGGQFARDHLTPEQLGKTAEELAKEAAEQLRDQLLRRKYPFPIPDLPLSLP